MADNCPADPGECWGLLGEAMPATARLSGIPSAVSSNMAKSYDLTMIQTQQTSVETWSQFAIFDQHLGYETL